MESEGKKSFRASEALAAHRRVKLSTTAGYVEYADQADDFIGVTMEAVSAEEIVALKLHNDPGTVEIEAAGAFDADATIYGADDGKVDDVSSGSDKFGKSLEAASGSAAVIEAIIDKAA